MLQPENQNKKYDHLFTEIDTGYVKIPKFQREFVWSKKPKQVYFKYPNVVEFYNLNEKLISNYKTGYDN